MQILTTKPSLICNILYTILGFFLFITFSREGEGRGHKTLSQKKTILIFCLNSYKEIWPIFICWPLITKYFASGHIYIC